MLWIAQIMTALVWLIHVYIVILETIWFKERGWKVFGFPEDKILFLTPIMSNQACYNGFLVAALTLGFIYPNSEVARAFSYFGLSCVAIAGMWGAATIMKRILFIQTLPASIALIALYLS
jgi:putative membrane protein